MTKASAGRVPSEGCEGESVSCLSPAPGGVLPIFCSPWLVDPSPCSVPSPAVVLCLFTQSSLRVCLCLCPNFPSNKDTSHIRLGPTLMTSFYLSKDPIFK